MLDTIINANGSPNWICLFLLMLISFLLGWFLKGFGNKKEVISSTTDTNNNAAADTQENVEDDVVIPSGVRARKTMERQGIAVKRKTLDFDSFGTANPEDKDDLKQINGIGPFIEEKLNSIGIYTFEQISRFNDHDIETVTALIEFFPGRIKRDNWKGQAQKLLSEKK